MKEEGRRKEKRGRMKEEGGRSNEITATFLVYSTEPHTHTGCN
jgi:hypothetical protein